MKVISRRDAIRAYRLTLAAPLISTPAFGKALPTQDSSSTTQSPPPPIPCSRDLIFFVNDQLLNTIVKLRHKTAQGIDLTNAAKFVHLFASHVSDSGFDSAVKATALAMDPSTIIGEVKPPSFNQFVKYCQTYDSSIVESDLWIPSGEISLQDASASLKTLAATGLSSMLHQAARKIHVSSRRVSGTVGGGVTAETQLRGHLVEGVYRPSSHGRAHLLHVCEPEPCSRWISNCGPPQWCADLSNDWNKLVKTVQKTAQACQSTPYLAPVCGALLDAASEAGVSLGTVLTWGTSIVVIVLAITCTK